MNKFANYKYREKEYAKYIHDYGFQTKHKPTELKLLLLYARDNLKEKNLKSYAESFCAEHEKEYNRALWFKTINDAVSYASDNKNKLQTIDCIPITYGEAEYIRGLPFTQDFKKLFFAFLIQMKLNKKVYEFKNSIPYTSTYFKGGIRKYNEIKKMANVSGKLDINGEFIHEMSQKGHIAIYYNGLIKHLWMDECKPSGDTVIDVKDFENVGYYFDYYCGEKGVKLCKECGQPFKVSAQCKTYCKRHKDYYKPVGEKVKACVDCGIEFTVDGRNNSKTRCATCQTKYRRSQDKLRKSH